MRAVTVTAVFAATVLGAALLGSAASIGAATDGLTTDSLLADAQFGAAFSGSAPRVPDDPDAPIRTGRWAEDSPPVELAGGPAVSADAAESIQVVTLPPPIARPRMAALDPDMDAHAPMVTLSRIAWAPGRRAPTHAPEPRIALTVSDQDIIAPGAGLDVASGVFNEPLAASRQPRSAPIFDMKKLTLRIGPTPSVRRKGRWFIFAAGSGEAFGLNLVRDPIRGWKPAGWSVEQLAEFGKAQLGIGWRKGARQVSLSAARREISAYGLSREDTVVGVTFSVSGRAPAQPRYEQRLPKAH